jgi:hypothetical protein
VRYATAKGGETKSGFRPSSRIFKFFLLVGLAATELHMGRLWAASGSLQNQTLHHSSRCATYNILIPFNNTTAQQIINPGALIFFSDEVTLMEPIESVVLQMSLVNKV